jgi:hypothetical protein
LPNACAPTNSRKPALPNRKPSSKTPSARPATRRLIQAGGLIEKAGLLELEPNALYGALLSLRDGAQQKDQVSQWAALGGRAFAREARLQDEGKDAIVLTFPAAIARDATMLLRADGFRFNKVLQHWEGLAHYDEAQKLATAHGGALRRVATSQPYPAPVPDRAAE